MKLRTLAALVAMGLAPAALAQAPAAAPAAKANIPRLCTNCHKPEAGEIYGNFEGVAFKSCSIQLKIDAATEIVRCDPKAIAVVNRMATHGVRRDLCTQPSTGGRTSWRAMP